MSTTSDSRTIYEIFSACRLCGAGGGYKMPIIQNIIPFDDCTDLELREKIRECVHIEVKSDDKMPPLICELCLDKVNDFYEFLEMCQQTNKRTRLRLGLPVQTTQEEPDDCILGVTETVFSNDEDKPVQRSRPCPKSKKNIVQVKKENLKIETPKGAKEKENQGSAVSKRLAKELAKLKGLEVKVHSETPRTTRNRESRLYVDSRSSSVSNRSSPVPTRETRRKTSVDQSDTPRLTRNRQDSFTSNSSARETRTNKSANDDNKSLGMIKQQEQKKKLEQQKGTKPIQKKGKDVKVEIISDSDDEALSTTRSKRGRDTQTPKAEVPQKRIKLTIKLPTPKVPTLAPNQCPVCLYVASSGVSFSNHMRRHPVLYTSPELACDPCGEWFPTAEEAVIHHKKHAKYRCRRCKRDYKQLAGYNEHFDKTNCKLYEEVPDVQCQTCWAFFPTATLMKQHTCPGTGSRPGGICKICTKLFTTLRSLKKHEEYCASKIKDSKPTKNELSKPVKNDVSKPSKNEATKSAKNEASKPAKNELSKPTKNEVTKSTKNEITKATKNEASKPAKKEASKPKKEVRIAPKVRSRLRPAAVRVAKCDPLLRKRKTRTGRYDVNNVPHDYGMDINCTYPYKYSGARVKSEPLCFDGMVSINKGARVKSEPLCFDGMVSINKEIQRELYREEDYVHWDSDLSSDSDNEEEEFGEKRRKVPTLTALTLKTIFSKRCLGKVPRKLRKVKQDKLFDSLFNTTVDDDLTCNINSIIDNLSKEDSSSVNLLNVGVNYDSDSVLEGGNDFDDVIKDVNKNSNKFDVNENGKANNDDNNDLGSKHCLNDGDDTDASMNDAKEDKNEELAKMNSCVSKESDKNDGESDRTEDLSSQNGDTQDEIFDSVVKNKGENEEINNETNKLNENENQEVTNDFETINEGNLESNNDIEEDSNRNVDDNNESKAENEETHTKNEETYKNGDFLNGISDKSDNFGSEIDEKKLMDDLNDQIGESEMKDADSRSLDACSFSIDNLIDKAMPQSFGLGSIGDEEFL